MLWLLGKFGFSCSAIVKCKHSVLIEVKNIREPEAINVDKSDVHL